MQTISSSSGRDIDEKADAGAVHVFLEAKRLGFRALLGWHYLILFAPLLAAGNTATVTNLTMNRQLVLYISLAATFALLFLAELRSKRARNFVASPVVIACACLLGAGSTLAAGFTFKMGFEVYAVVTVLLGASEAVLMLAWLQFFIELAKVQAYRTLGMDIITGAVVALVVEALTAPANFVIAACLPLLSAISFVVLHKRYKDSKRFEATQEEAEVRAGSEDGQSGAQADGLGQRRAFWYLLKRNIPTALFALAFGLMQGSFLSNGTMFLIAFNPLLFVGMAIAGLIIFFTSERFCTHNDVDSLYRLSLIFFAVGIVILMLITALMGSPDAFHPEVVLTAVGILIFAGFNLFDFGNMMMSLGIVRAQGGKFSYFVVGGRCIVYICMALGFGLGHALISWSIPVMGTDMLMAVCCVALLALIFTAAVSSMSIEDYANLLVSVNAENLESDESTAVAALSRPCEYCSSSENCSIRPLLLSSVAAAARAAAKEAELSDALSKLADSAKRHEQAQAARRAQEETEAAESTFATDSSDGAVSKHGRSPWRDACDEVAKRYRLSKRETQIFMLISKGRNAEYVSQELVISIHTAKTHIANIYQKLDVHSSQEMLNLIDEFRAYADEEQQSS